MRILVGLALLLCCCGVLPHQEVPCSNTTRCDTTAGVSDGGLGDGGWATGCSTGKGYYLGGQVWACPGTFAMPAPLPAALCAAGYTPCTAAGAADLATCMGLPGYFISQAFGLLLKNDIDPANVQCDATSASKMDGRLWMGCGRAVTGVTAFTAGTGCHGFPSYFDCRTNGSFSCSNSTAFEATTNSSAASGVLCCGQ